jgi:ElaB/YqjD/DUF883 family membrane-anchored ribosome-binding protein
MVACAFSVVALNALFLHLGAADFQVSEQLTAPSAAPYGGPFIPPTGVRRVNVLQPAITEGFASIDLKGTLMIASKPAEQSNNLADQAAKSADHAIRSTQRLANVALDSLAGTVQDMRDQAAPMLNHATEQAGAIVDRGADSIRDASQHVRGNALRAADSTVTFIKGEPVKAMLIAAATGAALMALLSLMSRSRNDR